MSTLLRRSAIAAALALFPMPAALAASQVPVGTVPECREGQIIHLAGCVDLETTMAGDLEISKARAVAITKTETRVYMTIRNRGAEPDRLKGAAAAAAGGVVLEGAAAGLALKPGETVELRPGGAYFSLTHGEAGFAGGEVELTLDFEEEGRVAILLPVLRD